MISHTYLSFLAQNVLLDEYFNFCRAQQVRATGQEEKITLLNLTDTLFSLRECSSYRTQ